MLAASSLMGCQKDNLDNNATEPTANSITRTLTIDQKEWNDNSTRSGYEPGVGIRLTGTETISVYYSAYDAVKAEERETYGLQTPVQATPTTNGAYTFSHDQIDEASEYNYYFMMPHLSTSGKNSAGTGSYHRLSSVQQPEAASFDPNFDYLVAQMQPKIAKSAGLDITKFKRLFAPLEVSITDGAGLFTGQKIRSVTLSLSSEATASQNLVGVFYANFSTDFAKTEATGWEATSRGNALTAEYPEGLAADNGTYPIWFMVNPTTIPAGSLLTLTVSTDKQTITRTVDLNGEKTILLGKINRLGFDLSGASSAAEKSFTQPFSALSTIAKSLTASDGGSYDWSFTGASIWKDGTSLHNALRIQADQSVVLPAISGVKVKRLRIIEHTNNSATAIQADNQLILKSGETVVATGNFNYYGEMAKTGGVCELTIPDEHQQSTLTLTKASGDKHALISSITFIYDGTITPADPNDFYDLWQKGNNITIGNLTINKTTHPSASVVNIDVLAAKDFIDGGLVFVDDKAATGAYTMTNTPVLGNDLVIIGRYKDSQPQVIMNVGSARTFNLAATNKTFAFKNLNFAGSGNGYLFQNSASGGDPLQVAFADCTFESSGNMIYDNNKTAAMQNVCVDNSVIKVNAAGKAVYGVATNKTTTDFPLVKNITLTNNVVYSETAVTGYLVMLGTAKAPYTTDNAVIRVENNTVFNIYYGNGIVLVYNASDMQFIKNVVAFDNATLGAGCYAMGYNKPNDPLEVVATSNFGWSNNTDKVWKGFWKGTDVTATIKTSNNTFNLSVSPFASTDLENSYFPVTGDAAAAGAGASYDTKLWKKWSK